MTGNPKNTRHLKVNPLAPEPSAIAQAATVLRDGGLVAFPTETVYGLGANALDEEAVRGIFVAKGRPANDPLIVHVASKSALAEVAAGVPPAALTLVGHFWPGPLTLVLPRAACIPNIVTSGGETVAVRMPAHPVALALLQASGTPIAAPSANRFGHVSPTLAEHVLADLSGSIDLVLDGGPTSVGVESTVLTLLTDPPTILRPGGVSREALTAVLGEVHVLERPVLPAESAPAPGMLFQHYAPHARLTLYRGTRHAALQAMREAAMALHAQGLRVGLLLAEEDMAEFTGLPVTLQSSGSLQAPAEIARQLFAALRALDQAEVQVILVRDFGAAGLGLAIRDRLTRAAGGNVIQVN
ncbi:MAG: threonylcarbamoyl-AMP synthase [Anaerolineae bacterium]|nr:threonylcarbamoyl-AMP synthase [Anaerolineae bacterium]